MDDGQERMVPNDRFHADCWMPYRDIAQDAYVIWRLPCEHIL